MFSNLSRRSIVLLVIAFVLIVFAGWRYLGSSIALVGSPSQDSTIIPSFQKAWEAESHPGLPADNVGIVWLKPSSRIDLQTALTGHRGKDWFVLEVFSSSATAAEAFSRKSFASDPPSPSAYYPLLKGQYVLISSSIKVEKKLQPLLG